MPLITTELVSDLTAAIAVASLDPSNWHTVLERLRGATAGTRTHIFGHDLKTGQDLSIISAGYEEAYLESFHSHFAQINPWIPGFVRQDVGRVTSSEEMLSTEALVRTEFYSDWVKPQEDILGGGGVVLFKDRDRFVALGGNVRRRDRETVEPHFLELIKLVVPHLRKAFEINRIMLGQSLLQFVGGQGNHQSETGVIVADRRSRVHFACPRAETLLNSGEVIRVDATGRLVDGSGRYFPELDHAARDLTVSGLPQSPLFFERMHTKHSTRYHFAISRLGAHDVEMSSVPDFLLGCRPCFVLAIWPDRASSGIEGALKAIYKLTGSEAEVAVSIWNGLSPRETAQERGTHVSTVRNQIRAILLKMDGRRYADIVRAVEDCRRHCPKVTI